MNRIIYLVGILGILYLIYASGAWLYHNHTLFFNQFFFSLGILTLVIGLGYLLYRILYQKDGFAQAGLTIFLGSGLKQAFHKFFKEQPQPDQATKAELATHLAWRLTRLGIIGLLLAILPIWLLMNQNQLLEKQNEMFKVQNEKIEVQNEMFKVQNERINLQNNLIEADRRSSLVFLMSNVLDKVDEEIKEQSKNSDKKKYSLSKPLISRIVALSRAFRPYRMMEGDSLSNELVSPERGQLFIALMGNNLDSITQNTILKSGDFSRATIEQIHLKKAKLNGAILRRAYLRRAYLVWTDLSGADLNGADLNGANLGGAILDGTNLSGADLNGANLGGAILDGTNLSGADLNGANLSEANLSTANLRGANLSEASLDKADFSFWPGLSGPGFSGADLSGADLSGADLSGVDFSNVKNLVIDQVKMAKTLYLCKNLDPKIKQQLQKEKPCLFTWEGCED